MKLNEEQNASREINNIPVDLGEIVIKVGEEIFDGIYNEKKYRYNARYLFDFNKAIDDRNLTPQKSEIGIKIITPYFDLGREFTELDLKMMSSRESSLIIKLPPDTAALKEMEDICRIRTYLSQKGGFSPPAEMKHIISRIAREVEERKKRVRSLLIKTLQEADFYANYQKINFKSKNPVERINHGFKILIEGIYSKLNYMTSFIESSKELEDILPAQESQLTLLNNEVLPNKPAMEEVKNYIERSAQRKIPVTMKILLDLYSKPPYGWLPDDIRGLVLRLFKSQEIRLQLDGEYLTRTDKALVKYTTQKEYMGKLIITKMMRTPEELLNNARQLIKNLFKISVLPGDEDGLKQRFRELLKNELVQINKLLLYYGERKYPDKQVLEEGRDLFEALLRVRDSLHFFETLNIVKDKILNYKENIVNVKKFFKNQKGYFDRAVRDLEVYEKNKTYILDGEIVQSVKEIEAILHADKPYSQISRLPALLDTFRKRFVHLLEKEIEPVKGVIEDDRKKVMAELTLYPFKRDFSSKFQQSFKELLNRVETCDSFYEALAIKEESDRLKLRCFEEMKKKKQEQSIKESKEKEPETQNAISTPAYQGKNVVNISIANIFHGARSIETEEDIEQLLDYLREQLKKELKENTRLKLI